MSKYKRNKHQAKLKKTRNENQTAIIYYRVSSIKQLDGTSLGMQLRECRKYCKANNLEVVAEFEEKGQSAKTVNRQEFIKAIDHARKVKVGAFVVWKFDRFARNAEDHLAVKSTLIKHGTRLHSATEPVDNSPSGKFMETMLAASAEFDNEVRSTRCYGGMMDRLRSGIYPHKPPVGYICERNKNKNMKKTTPDPIHPELHPIVQRALIGYMEKRYGQKGMVDVLNEQGYAEHFGSKATFSTTDRILRHYLDYYAGRLYCAADDEYYPGHHEPMITLEQMHRIVAIRDGRSNQGAKKERHNPEFPLRRTVLCGYCDGAMTGSSPTGRKGKKYPSYHCYNKQCNHNGKVIQKQQLESDFLDLLQTMAPSESFLAYIHNTVTTRQKKILEGAQEEAKVYDDAIAAVAERRKQIGLMAEVGVYSVAEAKERLAEVDAEAMVAKIEKSEQHIDYLEVEFEKEYFDQAILDVSKLWLDLVPEYRLRFQKLVLPTGIRYTKKNGFGTANLGYVFTLSSKSDGADLCKVDSTGLEPATSSVQMRRSTR